MNKQEIYALLARGGYWHEITEHPAVYTMEEVAALALAHPEAEAKTLFVRDDRKSAYYLITVRAEKRVDLKRFRREQGTRPLRFAPPEELEKVLGLYPGAVTPFGALNVPEGRVQVVLDRDFLDADGLIGVHPNDNTATVWLRARDLVDVLARHRISVIPVAL